MRGSVRRAIGSAVAVLAATALLAGCATAPRVDAGTVVTVGIRGGFTTANPAAGAGGGVVDEDIAALTTSGFTTLDADAQPVEDTAYGRAEIVSQEPFRVRYTMADDSAWSDGVPVDQADLLLAWAAGSHGLDDELEVAQPVDEETGELAEGVDPDAIVFDAVDSGLSGTIARADPDGRGITVQFPESTASWEDALRPGIPAHVLARRALDLRDPGAAKRAVVAAIESRDRAALAPLSLAWTRDWRFTEMPEDTGLLVASGPYRIASIEPGERVELVANPGYRGLRQPIYERIAIRTLDRSDDLADLLAAGEVDVASASPTAATVRALQGVDGLTIETGQQNRMLQLVLKVRDGLNVSIEDPLVRRALLRTVPREQMVRDLVTPVDPAAGVADSFVFHPLSDDYAPAIAKNGSVAYDVVDTARAEEFLQGAADRVHRVCVLFDPDDRARAAQFELMRASAEEVGIRVESCATKDWEAQLAEPGTWDAALVDVEIGADGRAPVAAEFRTDAADNIAGISDPELDALLDRVRAADGDPSRQTELLTEVDRRLWDLAVGAPLYAPPSIVAVGPGVDGVSRSPLATSVLWNAWAWRPAAPSPSPSGSPAEG